MRFGLSRKNPADQDTAAAKQPQHRVGLWVLAAFAVIAALVAISAAVIGPQNADLMLVIPLALFWSVTICIGFAIRAALVNVVRSLSRPLPKADLPDAALERLARMAQRERNRAMTHPHLARGLMHAA